MTASIFTSNFNYILSTRAVFDCRAFNIPEDDVPNYFIWRQQDWIRNSVQMLARHYFSHKECEGKSQSDLNEMLFQNDINWANLPSHLKNGTFITNENDRLDAKLNYSDLAHFIKYYNRSEK